MKGNTMKSKAEIIREMYLEGKMTNSPDDKKKIANELGITVQTVHATIMKMLVDKKVRQDNHQDIRQMVIDAFDNCYDIARSKGIELVKIPIQFDLNGTCAGQYCARKDYFGVKRYFRVNLQIAKDNLEDYLKETIPHEFCHYYANANYGRVQPHGDEWKRAMIVIFGISPRRCHNYDVSNAQRRTVQRYAYSCGCRIHRITSMKHNKLQRNPKQYICNICKNYLTYQSA